MRASQRTKDSILFDYGHLTDGVTVPGEVCPECGGGITKEGSLSVTRNGNRLLFNCHRASCGVRGALDVGGSLAPFVSDGLDRTYPIIHMVPPNQALIKALALKFHMPAENFEFAGVGWTGDAGKHGKRVGYPIYDPEGRERGCNYRSYEGAKPKNIIHLRNKDVSKGAWYKWIRKSKALVIVEDQVSAMKLAPYVHAVAICGSNIGVSLAEEIAAQNYSVVVLSLDNDATMTAIKEAMRWRQTIKGLVVVPLEKDLKDQTQDELNEYLQPHLLTDPT